MPPGEIPPPPDFSLTNPPFPILVLGWATPPIDPTASRRHPLPSLHCRCRPACHPHCWDTPTLPQPSPRPLPWQQYMFKSLGVDAHPPFGHRLLLGPLTHFFFHLFISFIPCIFVSDNETREALLLGTGEWNSGVR